MAQHYLPVPQRFAVWGERAQHQYGGVNSHYARKDNRFETEKCPEEREGLAKAASKHREGP